jgi:peptidase M23-like protein
MTRIATILAATVALVLLLAPPARAGGWTWPLRGELITLFRNGSDPYAAGQHRGIDIAGRVGAPVVAAAAGSVRFAGAVGSSGLTVSVRTADGRYDTSYLHLSVVSVRAGERVAAGARVGAVGTAGRRSATRPHLHFGVREAGSRHAYRDPLDFLPAPPVTRPDRAPRGAPAPVGAPARPTPAPVWRPLPAPAPAGRRVPAPSRRHAPAGRRASRGAPGRVPGTALAPVGSPGPWRHPRPDLAGRRSPNRAPQAAPAAPEPGPAPARSAAARPLAGSHRGGRDLGLLLGCLGLLLASGLLGFWPGGDANGGQPGKRLRSVWRPVVARIAQGRRT